MCSLSSTPQSASGEVRSMSRVGYIDHHTRYVRPYTNPVTCLEIKKGPSHPHSDPPTHPHLLKFKCCVVHSYKQAAERDFRIRIYQVSADSFSRLFKGARQEHFLQTTMPVSFPFSGGTRIPKATDEQCNEYYVGHWGADRSPLWL